MELLQPSGPVCTYMGRGVLEKERVVLQILPRCGMQNAMDVQAVLVPLSGKTKLCKKQFQILKM